MVGGAGGLTGVVGLSMAIVVEGEKRNESPDVGNH